MDNFSPLDRKIKMQARVRASPNIALIKYWGKRDEKNNLPAVSSISITLDDIWTETKIKFSPNHKSDILIINNIQQDNIQRVSDCIDSICGKERNFVSVSSKCNFPISAGLASSSSAFSALVSAINHAVNKGYELQDLANEAGKASGSAARSMLGGFVELENKKNKIHINQLLQPKDWPLRVVIAITDSRKKAVSSSEGMKLSSKTSPFYNSWVKNQPEDIDEARKAILSRDFLRLAEISEHNCMKMHSVMWTSRPSIVYWNSATIECLHAIRELQKKGEFVFFTIDAGPQIKAVCLPESEPKVINILKEIKGVKSILQSGLGQEPQIQ